MSIKCSVLGHRFGETQVERDREEDGTEVVITITELESCTRCGETRVVSENKEVTTMEAAPGTGGSGDGAAAGAGGGAAAETSERAGSDSGSTGGRDAEFVDETAPDSNAQAEARSAPATIPDAESGSTGGSVATDDDAVIIDDDDPAGANANADDAGDDAPGGGTAGGDSADGGADGSDESPEERSPGEWPEEPEGVDPAERAGETAEVEILGSGGGEGADDASDVADRTDAAERSDAETEAGQSDVATGADAVGETSAGEEYGGRDRGVESASAGDDGAGAATGAIDGVDAPASGDEAWPQDEDDSALTAGEEAMGDWPEETKRDEPADPRAAGPSLDGDDSPSITVPEGMFKCTECGFTTEVESSPLRAGDFCPECRSGTLAQASDADEE